MQTKMASHKSALAKVRQALFRVFVIYKIFCHAPTIGKQTLKLFDMEILLLVRGK